MIHWEGRGTHANSGIIHAKNEEAKQGDKVSKHAQPGLVPALQLSRFWLSIYFFRTKPLALHCCIFRGIQGGSGYVAESRRPVKLAVTVAFDGSWFARQLGHFDRGRHDVDAVGTE
jgi:hypothetical protein